MMKIITDTRSIAVSIFILASLIPVSLSAQTSTDCPPEQSPAGTITCPSRLAAVCVVRDGRVYGKCIPAPKVSSSNTEKIQFFMYGYRESGIAHGEASYDLEQKLDQASRTGNFMEEMGDRGFSIQLPRY